MGRKCVACACLCATHAQASIGDEVAMMWRRRREGDPMTHHYIPAFCLQPAISSEKPAVATANRLLLSPPSDGDRCCCNPAPGVIDWPPCYPSHPHVTCGVQVRDARGGGKRAPQPVRQGGAGFSRRRRETDQQGQRRWGETGETRKMSREEEEEETGGLFPITMLSFSGVGSG